VQVGHIDLVFWVSVRTNSWLGYAIVRRGLHHEICWFADYAEIINNDRMSGWQFSAGLRKEL